MFSIFEYGAPVWYPLLSPANLESLVRLQRKALRVILGVTQSTRINDFLLEASLLPVEARLWAITALQAEKYRCRPSLDPRLHW